MSKLRIIIAEADIQAALELRTKLTRLGYHVMAIANMGHNLISLVREHTPDLVITEISLEARTEGIELAAVIQDELIIPVVFVTRHSDLISLIRDKNIEMYSYVIKPFSDERLQTAIETALARHQAEIKIRVKLSEAEKLKTVKSELISLLSHEGRSPLTSILMSADLLHRYSNSSSEAQRLKCLNRIRASVEYLNKLLEDVLTLDRSDSQNWSLNLEAIDLSDFCQQIMDDINDQGNDQSNDQSSDRGRIELHCQNVPESFYTDSRLLQHILSNLLTNAIKYSPANSKVDLHLEGVTTGLEIRVCDRGRGIPAADIPHLFEPFFRASNAAGCNGTGLGLSIVGRFVEILLGNISVRSEEGKGSTFTLTLPALTPQAQPLLEMMMHPH
jgi:signal transduction histidine kinase